MGVRKASNNKSDLQGYSVAFAMAHARYKLIVNERDVFTVT